MHETKAMKVASGNIRDPESGFTLTEMMVSSLLFLVGLVAVAQLVPAAISLNLNNRNDSSALTDAEREMVQFLDQQLNQNGTSMTQFTDADGNICQLGDPNSPNTVVGSPVAQFGSQVVIDFGQGAVPGYSLLYRDPNDPSATQYDIRWAVVTSVLNGTTNAVSKRFIVGARRRGGNGFAQPANLDAWKLK